MRLVHTDLLWRRKIISPQSNERMNTTDSLQREPDIVLVKPKDADEPAQWPAYMIKNKVDDGGNLPHMYKKSTERAYQQSHPYESMFYPAEDLKIDEIQLNNNYMRLIFGGKVQPDDNMQLAYNHAVRQMSEVPIEKDSLLGHQNPLDFVEGAPATKESLLNTFEKQRQYYKGEVDSDAERALKQRPTHRLIATTFYGKKQQRFNPVTGQAHLLNRPVMDGSFKPMENLSSRTYAPDGFGGEVPLDAELVFGADPREVKVTGEAGKQMAPRSASHPADWVDMGNYTGREIDRQHLDFKGDQDPQFANLFRHFKKRM